MDSPTPDPSSPEEESGPKPLPGAVAFLGMGLAAAVCVALPVFAGVWADSHWHTAPLFFVIGLVLGLTAAVVSVITQIRQYL